MNTAAYEPSFTEPNGDQPRRATFAPEQLEHVEPPAPPRMRVTPGEGGLGPMFAALAKAQANFKPVKADAHVQVDTREKGSYKFSYAPLENVLAACVPALNEQGFFFSQPLYSSNDGEGYVLRTCLFHEKGGSIELEVYIPKPTGRIQDLGSAITYQRRYVAQALFGVNSEDDDDGAQASGDKRTVQPPRAPTPSAAPPPARNGGPAPAPKAGPSGTSNSAPAAGAAPANGSAAAPASPASSAAEPADATGKPETTVDRPFTPEQDGELKNLFGEVKKHVKLSGPGINAYVQRLTGVEAVKMQEGHAAQVIADLKRRIEVKDFDFSPPRAAS